MSEARYAVDRRPAIVWSEGLRLAADILTPNGLDGPGPAILLCHGWGGRKQHLLELYARYFAAAGHVVMVFDYRTWGESDGKPVPVADEPMLTAQAPSGSQPRGATVRPGPRQQPRRQGAARRPSGKKKRR